MGQSRQAGFGPLAQMVEHRHHTPRVTGSIPVRSTMRSSKQAEHRVRKPGGCGFESRRRAQTKVLCTRHKLSLRARSDRVNRAGLIAREVACDVRVSGPLAQMGERLVYTQ